MEEATEETRTMVDTTPRPAISRRYALAALGSSALVAPTGLRAQTAVKTFTFGAMFPTTGQAAEIGQDQVRGLELAVDEINARGGVDGWRFKGTVVDHKATAAGGVQAINQLVNIERVPFVITSFSGATLAALPIAAQSQVILFNSGGTSVNLLDRPWLYNNAVIGEPLNAPMVDYAWAQGMRTAAIIISEDPLGRDNAPLFAAGFTKRGGRIVASESYSVGSTDFLAQLTKIKATNPQMIYQVGAGDAQGLLVKQTRAIDYKGLLMGPLATPNIYEVGGKAADGFITAAVAIDRTSHNRGVQRFVSSYKAKYSKEPDWVQGCVYEGVFYLADLVHDVMRSGGDPHNGAVLLKAIDANPSFVNVLSGGRVTLQKNHGSIRAVGLSEVRDNKFVTIKVVTPKA
jgi:branched-chain amino acid transport system substrate-binding protein